MAALDPPAGDLTNLGISAEGIRTSKTQFACLVVRRREVPPLPAHRERGLLVGPGLSCSVSSASGPQAIPIRDHPASILDRRRRRSKSDRPPVDGSADLFQSSTGDVGGRKPACCSAATFLLNAFNPLPATSAVGSGLLGLSRCEQRAASILDRRRLGTTTCPRPQLLGPVPSSAACSHLDLNSVGLDRLSARRSRATEEGVVEGGAVRSASAETTGRKGCLSASWRAVMGCTGERSAQALASRSPATTQTC